ncbi:hypothetical protein [Alkalitalea saponilacus]|uniref:Uncharacterized protein n=1 Tax=Alkalitalea saponilacus TaxID=889453 RepID=A0A1T5HUA8_9BACT|nr:hypothetical protein [Alkalitalea saponilacus]SKC24276.1 hypothetical protein SAMN03080601_03573 [Alkalitalea saponilacus]
MKRIIFLLGTALISFSSCYFNMSSSGSIQLETTKDSMDIVLKNVREIVEGLNHNDIKKEITEKFKDFDKNSINNINIGYTKFWSAGGGDNKATVIIRVNISSSDFEKSREVIDFYEGFIIPELKKNGYIPREQ